MKKLLPILVLLLALPSHGSMVEAFKKPPKTPPPATPNHVLELDFLGDTTATWSSGTTVYHPGTTPPYPNLSAIPTIVAGLQAYFSPYDLLVTTTPTPGAYRMVIGGNGAWSGTLASGLTFIDSYRTGPFEDFVFSEQIGNDPVSVTEIAAHEFGHALDLQHQSVWANGVKTQEYNPGDANYAPLMGNPLGRALDHAVWWKGTNSQGVFQDDAAVVLARLGPSAGQVPEVYTFGSSLVILVGLATKRRCRQ